MKRTTLLMLGVIIVATATAQDTLVLSVGNLTDTNKITLSHGETVFKRKDALPVGSNWFLSIRPGGNKFTVRIENSVTGSGSNSATLTNADSIYEIRNDSLIGTSLKLGANIRIKIIRPDEKTAKDYLNLSLSSSGRKIPTPTEKNYNIGSAIYDAFYLSSGGDIATKMKILAYYADVPMSEAELKKAYSNNKFLMPFVEDSLKRAVAQGLNAAKIFSSLSASSIGGLDVTNIADGLAKFLVRRARQELSIAFFEKFKRVIDSTEDIATLFPQTAGLLDAIDQQIYDYEHYIQNLREAFKEDVLALPGNFPGIIDNHKDFFTRHKELKATLLSGCYIAGELESHTHPGDILANYPVEYLDSINKNYKGAIQTIQLVSESLKDTSSAEDKSYWVGIKKVRELAGDKKTFKFYLGLLLQQSRSRYDSIHYENFTLDSMLNLVGDKYDEGVAMFNAYKRYISVFGEKIDALNKMIKDYPETATDSSSLEKYAKYFRASVDIIEYCTKSTTLPVIRDRVPRLDLLLSKYFDVAYSVTDMVIDIHRRNYSSAINHAVHVYNVVRVKPARESADRLQQSLTKKEKRAVRSYNASLRNIEKLTGNKLPDALKSNVDSVIKQAVATSSGSVNVQNLAVDSVMKESAHSGNALNKLVKYGSFIASVATAKSSDDVEKAIETAALPVGSSRIKRSTPFSVSLNGYAGLFIGHESIKGIKDKGGFNSYGVAAPVGVAISRGHSIFFVGTGQEGWTNGKKEWSTSLFISLIDVGAVAAFRFRDDTTAQVPTIQLKNIFSPGAFISIGLPKCPLSVNMGAQIGPNLRKIDKNSAVLASDDNNNKLYTRYSLSVVVDIPIFNFHVSSK